MESTHVGQVCCQDRLGSGGDPPAEEARQQVLADPPRANAGAERGAKAGRVGHGRQQHGRGGPAGATVAATAASRRRVTRWRPR